MKLIAIYGEDCSLDRVLSDITNTDNYIDIYADAGSNFKDGKRQCGIGVFFRG